MDVGEILNFKPEMAVKRAAEEEEDEKDRPGKKRGRLESRGLGPQPPSSHLGSLGGVASARTRQIVEEKLMEFEEQENSEVTDGPLNESLLKKMILSFEKRVLKNQELRIKFPDDPRKFMESEVELNDAVEELHVVATVPELYPVLVELGTVKSLLSLLSHDNTDIAIATVDLLQEMTELEDIQEEEGAEALIDALLEGQVVTTLVHNLQRMDESNKAEADGVHNSLGIIENLAEVRVQVCRDAGPGGLLAWLLKRLRAKLPFDANKLYSSEILAICMQNHEENRRLLGEMDGIDVLLQQLAVYKRHDPSTNEEQEMMENLFDTLCSCLMFTPNRDLFLRGEGLQLMNLMLREKKLSRNGALRVLDHALTGQEGADNCNKFVEILGLRTIFPLFMKTPGKHGKKGLTKDQHEEHVISIITSLLRNCRPNQRTRLINKFTENDHEKVDRLLELHFKYLEKVLATNLEEQAKTENLDEDELYLRRLDGGLFTLQLVDYIMLDVCATGPPSIKRRVLKILNLRNASVKTIKNIMREYASNLGDGTNSDAQAEEQDRILDLLDKFQNT
uniref:Beta-catenin-like protein 1 n=2 Tax=Penaeus vannamei TaxID=6689 RepID=A0A1W5SY68_PENVA|nr:beta-catenin-like protein 1 isoform X1 [Penaeus vannamei]ARE72526.1 beta-catenin-like protein 1 [Penaeus vannamei]